MSRRENVFKTMICGGSSGMIAKTLLAPLDRTKIILQLQGMKPLSRKYTSIFSMMRDVTKTEGITSLWKGNGANLIRVIPNAAIKFTLNDHLRSKLLQPGQRKLSFNQLLIASSITGFVQITTTYPLDFARTRLAITQDQLKSNKYTGIWNCLSQTIQNEGMSGIYKGIVPSLLTGVPFIALQLSTFEFFKGMFSYKSDLVTGLTCGALAGFCAQSLTYPGDTIRRKMKANGLGNEAKQFTSTLDAVIKTMKIEGIKGFYRGFLINTISVVPGVAIQLCLFDLFKKWASITHP